MRTKSLLAVIACCAFSSSGCSLCCAPYDNYYATTGGKHQRVDMEHGRLGSIFSDPTYAQGIAVTEHPVEEIYDDAVLEEDDSDAIYIPDSESSDVLDSQVQYVSDDEEESLPPAELKIGGRIP